MKRMRDGVSRRAVLKSAVAVAAASAVGSRAPAVLGQAKKFAGIAINGAGFTHVHQTHIKELLPEFERTTGIKVNFDTQAFPIYNQRADLELSTKGQAYDFLCITYIYASRWIGAGWFFPLDDFVSNPNTTPSEWDAADFDPASLTPMKDARGKIYGFPWEQSALLMAASRADLLEKAGLKMPETLKELGEAVAKVHGVDGVAGYISHTTHHWVWVPYLMGMGGKVFKDSPENLTPTLDTDVAGEAMQFYGDLLRKHSPSGVLSFQDAQAMQVQLNGRANFRTQSVAWLTPLASDPKSAVRQMVRFGLMPAGPAGRFPGVNSHGYGIPVGSRNKEAAWEFIKWVGSKEVMRRLIERGYTSVARLSLLRSDLFKEKHQLNGQDVAAMIEQTLKIASSGYMKYRNVPVWPEVGESINKAVQRVASGQQTGRQAVAQAQAEIIADFKKGGVKMDI